jgi:hypothetical protein
MPPRARHLSGCDEARGETAEPDLPLVSPDLQVDVDDVVIRGRQPAQPVADPEGALLGQGPVMPDDPKSLVGLRRTEGVRRSARAELGRRARGIGAIALEDGDLVDPLPVRQRDLAERAAEIADVAERDPLVDDQGAVPLHLDEHVRGRQRERLGLRLPRQRERGEDGGG